MTKSACDGPCGSTTRALYCATGWAAYRVGKSDPHAGGCSCRVFRCVTDWRAERKARRAATHDKRVQRVFGLEPGQYDALLASQGGTCAVSTCRANGGGKRALAVDHDHKCCPGKTSCGKCVRGLLCSRHNQMLADAFDNPETLMSLAFYLEAPPARGFVYDGHVSRNGLTG
jgi:hypothetical protein